MIDYTLLLSDSQAVTADAKSTNTIQLDGVQQIGRGNPMAVIMNVEVAADYTTEDETYTFAIRTSANSDMTSSTTLSSYTIAAADLSLGSVHVFPFPLTNDEYIDLYYDVGGTTPTITVTSYLGTFSSANTGFDQSYPVGYTQ